MKCSTIIVEIAISFTSKYCNHMITMNIANEMLILLVLWSVARLTIGIITGVLIMVTSYAFEKQSK